MPIFTPELYARHTRDIPTRQEALAARLSGAPAQAPSQGIGIAPYLALLGGQGLDAGTTIAASRNPNLHETNPMGYGGALAAKAGVTLGLILLMKKLAAEGHPTAAKTLGYIGGAGGAIPGALNLRTMAQNK